MTGMTRRRDLLIGSAFIAVLATLGVSERALTSVADAQAKDMVTAPRFEVDPTFPKPLPNHWIMGETIGLGIDSQDHIWIVHRQGALTPAEAGLDQKPPTASCCSAAPPVLAFDSAGNLV